MSRVAPGRARPAIAFAILLGVEFLYGWVWNSVDVLRPHIRASLGLSLFQSGTLYSAQAAGALVGAVVLGQLADRAGRRRLLMACLVAMSLLLALGAVARSFPLIFGQRVMLGFCMGAIPPTVGSLYIGLFAAEVRGRLASLLNAVFTGSVIGLGYGLAALPRPGMWPALFWIGAAGVLALAPLLLLVPDDRPAVQSGMEPASPLRRLFSPGLRRWTLMLMAMSGLNYFAAQAFTGWTASYLTDIRAVAPLGVAAALGAQATGSVLGGFVWGWWGDRFGRRSSLFGYLIGAALMAWYVLGVRDADQFRYLGFAIGIMIAANVVWPPWMAEIFPEEVRATALSIFNWGRVVSLFAPLVTGAIAEQAGLAAAMLLGPAALMLVTLFWRSFPETLERRRATP